MNSYVFSPSENAFYLGAMKDDYLSAGTCPTDSIYVDTDDAVTFRWEALEDKACHR